MNPVKHPHAKKELAAAFADYLVSNDAQALIAGYRKFDQQLFFTYEE